MTLDNQVVCFHEEEYFFSSQHYFLCYQSLFTSLVKFIPKILSKKIVNEFVSLIYFLVDSLFVKGRATGVRILILCLENFLKGFIRSKSFSTISSGFQEYNHSIFK